MSDWTTDATNAIDSVVGLVRERAVDPVQTIVRAIIYGLLAALILIPAVTLLTIGVFRVLVIATDENVWAAWTGLGGIFLIIGWFCWIKRNP